MLGKKPDSAITETPKPLNWSPLILKSGYPGSQIGEVADDFARSLRLAEPAVTGFGKNFALFGNSDVKKLLRGKMVVFIGDSVTRAAYKDLVHLCHADSMAYPFDLQKKAELRYQGDILIKGSKLDGSIETNGVDFEEVRIFLAKEIQAVISYTFVTKMYNNNIARTMAEEYFSSQIKYGFPDIVFMNSCNWDLVRHKKFRTAQDFEKQYESDMRDFIRHFMRLSQGKSCLIFLSTLPLSETCTGAFLSEKKDTLKSNNLVHTYIKPANEMVRRIVDKKRKEGYPIGYLDLHTLSVNLELSPWRENDGTHWKPQAHRVFSYAILSVISRLSQKSLPISTNFEPFFRACDSVAQFDVSLRWLTTRYLRKTGTTLEELEYAWEHGRGGVDKEEAITQTAKLNIKHRLEPIIEAQVRDESRAAANFTSNTQKAVRLHHDVVNGTNGPSSGQAAVNGGSFAGDNCPKRLSNPHSSASPYANPSWKQAFPFVESVNSAMDGPDCVGSASPAQRPLLPHDDNLICRLQLMAHGSPAPAVVSGVQTPPFHDPEDVVMSDAADDLPIGFEAADLNYLEDGSPLEMRPQSPVVSVAKSVQPIVVPPPVSTPPAASKSSEPLHHGSSRPLPALRDKNRPELQSPSQPAVKPNPTISSPPAPFNPSPVPNNGYSLFFSDNPAPLAHGNSHKASPPVTSTNRPAPLPPSSSRQQPPPPPSAIRLQPVPPTASQSHPNPPPPPPPNSHQQAAPPPCPPKPLVANGSGPPPPKRPKADHNAHSVPPSGSSSGPSLPQRDKPAKKLTGADPFAAMLAGAAHAPLVTYPPNQPGANDGSPLVMNGFSQDCRQQNGYQHSTVSYGAYDPQYSRRDSGSNSSNLGYPPSTMDPLYQYAPINSLSNGFPMPTSPVAEYNLWNADATGGGGPQFQYTASSFSNQLSATNTPSGQFVQYNHGLSAGLRQQYGDSYSWDEDVPFRD